MSVYFVKDISLINIEVSGSVLVVYHSMYIPPKIKNASYIVFDKYKIEYNNYEPDLIVLVGLNRIITPSNRCEFVFEYLFNLANKTKKISIDNEPFVGEPWRLWFHYGITKRGKFNINYSYPIETEWTKWFLRDVKNQDCRLSSENIGLFIDNTYSDLNKLTTTFNFYELDDVSYEWYSEVKKHVFNKYNSPKLLINNLLKECNNKYDIKIKYDDFKTNNNYCLPNLPIYKFIVEEMKRRMNIYNEVIKNGKNI